MFIISRSNIYNQNEILQPIIDEIQAILTLISVRDKFISDKELAMYR